jgi:hypothetical protein
MFPAALFIIVKIHRCPSTDEQIKTVWYLYNGILLSLKKDGNPVICNKMHEAGGCFMLSESKPAQKDKPCRISLRRRIKETESLGQSRMLVIQAGTGVGNIGQRL